MHAKWSPVATAYYRLLPDIELQKMTKAESQKLVDICPMNVFEMENKKAVVKNVTNCTMCRECIRSENGL